MPVKPGVRLGKQRENLTLFGECLYALCDHAGLSLKMLEKLLEESPGTLSPVTRSGPKTHRPARALVEHIDIVLQQVIRKQRLVYNPQWSEMLFHAASYATDTEIEAARRELDKLRHARETPTQNEYFIDPDSKNELNRLFKQGRFVTQATGGLLPDQGTRIFGRVLDLACGPGQWCLDLAQHRPLLQCVGVDISHRFISYAQTQEARLKLDNRALFRVMDVTRPLDIPDDSFDLVNGRMLHGFLARDAWSTMLQEALRVLHTGGVLRLMEDEFPITSSPAAEQLGTLYARAYKVAGKSFSPTGETYGITAHLPRLVRQAGCMNVQSRASAIDISYGSPYHAAMLENVTVAMKNGQAFLLKYGVTTQEEQDALYAQLLDEVQREDFVGVWNFLTAWGEKP